MQRSLSDIIHLLLCAGWRRRYLICVPFVLMIPLSIIGARFAPKTYEAKTILLLQETGKDNPFLKDFAVGLNLKERISALQALLKSEHVLLNVLRDIHGGNVETDPRALAMEMRQLGGNISVQLVGSDLLELKLKGARPEGLGKMLEAISARFLERLLSPERSTLGATQAFLQDQLEKRRKALDLAETELSRFKSANADKIPAIFASNITRLGAIRQKLEEKSMELSAATAAFNDMRRQLAGTNPIVGRLEESIIQVTGELTALKARYTDDHSDVQAAERKLRRLQEERRSYLDVSNRIEKADMDRLWNIALGQGGDNEKAPPLLVSQLTRLQDAHAKRVALEKDVEQIKAVVEDMERNIPAHAPIEQQQQRLEKEVTSARETYEAFLKRYENAKTSRALGEFEAVERVKFIDLPQDPTIPVTPPKIIFIVAGIIAGLVVGIGLATVAELLDPSVHTAAEMALLCGAPVLARLPRDVALLSSAKGGDPHGLPLSSPA